MVGPVVGLYVGASWGETGRAIGSLLGFFIAAAVGIGAGFDGMESDEDEGPAAR